MASTHTPDTIETIPLARLIGHPENFRRHLDAAELDDLEQSVRQMGIVEPLLVRPHGEGFQILSGHRRFEVARRIGLAEVPAIVKSFDDQAALEHMVVVNLQRAGVSPMDEAAGFQRLLPDRSDLAGVVRIAARIGKPKEYVWNRLTLLNLVPTAQKLLEDHIITVPHAVLLARLTPGLQARVIHPNTGGLFTREQGLGFDESAGPRLAHAGLKPVSLRELQTWIAEHVRFDVQHAATTAPLDFGPVAERVETATHQPGRGKKVVHITHDYHVLPEAKAEGDRTYCHDSWKRADGERESKTCDRALLGVVVVGHGYGDAYAVCIDKTCDVHWKKERTAREKAQRRTGASGTKGGRAQQSWERRQHERQVEEDAKKEAFEAQKPVLGLAAAARIGKAKITDLAKVVFEGLGRYGRHAGDKAVLAAAAKHLPAFKTGDDIVRRAALIFLLQVLDDWDAYRAFARFAKRAIGLEVATILKAEAKKAAASANVLGKTPASSKTASDVPGVCRVCGCTEDKACAGGCSWADKTRTLCTSCVDAAPARAKTARPRKGRRARKKE